MPRFCPLTGQLLVPIISGAELTFVSIVTKKSYQATNEDTLRYVEDLKKSSTSTTVRQILNINDDGVNPRKIGLCPSCKKLAIIASIQNGDEMETINSCHECGYQYPET